LLRPLRAAIVRVASRPASSVGAVESLLP
jgi:hypothetical protein